MKPIYNNDDLDKYRQVNGILNDEGQKIFCDRINNYLDKKDKDKDKEIERLNKIIEIKNNRIQQLMKRTRSSRINKAIEYIYENTDFQHDGDDYGYMEWVDLKTNTQDFVETLIDILKGEDKE